jgi:hypothetical protein
MNTNVAGTTLKKVSFTAHFVLQPDGGFEIVNAVIESKTKNKPRVRGTK